MIPERLYSYCISALEELAFLHGELPSVYRLHAVFLFLETPDLIGMSFGELLYVVLYK